MVSPVRSSTQHTYIKLNAVMFTFGFWAMERLLVHCSLCAKPQCNLLHAMPLHITGELHQALLHIISMASSSLGTWFSCLLRVCDHCTVQGQETPAAYLYIHSPSCAILPQANWEKKDINLLVRYWDLLSVTALGKLISLKSVQGHLVSELREWMTSCPTSHWMTHQ